MVDKVWEGLGGNQEDITIHREVWGIQGKSKINDRHLREKASAKKKGERGSMLETNGRSEVWGVQGGSKRMDR